MSAPATTCLECGHEHSGPALGHICVGCPCAWRPTAPAPGTRYCAQCWMNGSGKFALIGEDCTNPNCVLYVRGYKKRPATLSALSTPTETAREVSK